ncbi:unnamed protein product, partial [Prorocentrum cordatum]
MHAAGTEPAGPPEGLILGSVADTALVDAALAEMGPRFQGGATFEAGISYKIMESKGRRSVGLPIARVPATWELILAAMAALRRDLPADPAADANVICRRYAAGDRLGFHRDAVGLFGGEVFGAVLTDSGPGLVFRRGAAAEREEYAVPERRGAVFLSGGASRYAWCHGVPPRPEGSPERVSRHLAVAAPEQRALAEPGGPGAGAVAARVPRRLPRGRLRRGGHRCFPLWRLRVVRHQNDRMGPRLSEADTSRALGARADGRRPPALRTRGPPRGPRRPAAGALGRHRGDGRGRGRRRPARGGRRGRPQTRPPRGSCRHAGGGRRSGRAGGLGAPRALHWAQRG